jgi:hypothetical protein
MEVNMATALVGIQHGYEYYATRIAKAQSTVDEWRSVVDRQCNERQAQLAKRELVKFERRLALLQREAPPVGTPDAIRIEVDFDLTSRGYKYEHDPLYSLAPAWVKIGNAPSEIKWLTEHGAEVKRI